MSGTICSTDYPLAEHTVYFTTPTSPHLMRAYLCLQLVTQPIYNNTEYEEAMNLIITVLLLISLSYIVRRAAGSLGVPSVIALLGTGILFGMPIVKNALIEPNTSFVVGLGDIALVGLMFLAGLESSWHFLYQERNDALFIALFAALVPFTLGFLTLYLLGFSAFTAVIVGLCMSITAEATKASVLMELGKLRTKVGAAMMGAGIIDDIFGLSVFTIITSLLHATPLKEDILLVMSLLAFVAGLLTRKHIGRHHETIVTTEKFLWITLIPFFFIAMGMHVNLSTLLINPMLLFIIIALALIGKLLGTFVAKPFTSFSWKQLHVIGWGMNSRGAVELALALIAVKSNLISFEIYSGLVVMALVTTCIFPIIVGHLIQRSHHIQ